MGWVAAVVLFIALVAIYKYHHVVAEEQERYIRDLEQELREKEHGTDCGRLGSGDSGPAGARGQQGVLSGDGGSLPPTVAPIPGLAAYLRDKRREDSRLSRDK